MATSLPPEAQRMRDAVEAKLGPTVAALLDARAGCAQLLIELPIALPAVQMTEMDAQDVWHSCGLYYQFQGRLHEALAIYDQMYEQYLLYQDTTGRRVHKGGALVRVSECHLALGHPVLAKRYLMLTTCEDALIHNGEIPPETTGVYFRMVWQYGMPHDELARYAQTMWTLAQQHPEPSRFPEWVVQHVDQHWMTGVPVGRGGLPLSDEPGVRSVAIHASWRGRREGAGVAGGISVERHARVPRVAAATELFDGLRRRLHAGGA